MTATRGISAQAPLILTVTVKSVGSSKVPTGAVLIYNASNVIIATGALQANGSFSWLVPADLATQVVHASYVGNSNFATSVSAPLNEASVMSALFGN